MNTICTSLLVLVSLIGVGCALGLEQLPPPIQAVAKPQSPKVPKGTTFEGVTLSLQVRSDDEAITFTFRTAVRDRSRFIFNPQFKLFLGAPGRLDVYNEQGDYLGDLLGTLSPFGVHGGLSSNDWIYLHDMGVVESQFRVALDNVSVLQDRKRISIVPGEECLTLTPGETYTFQLVADERFLSEPSLMGIFKHDRNKGDSWQNNSPRHKVIIRSNAVKLKLPDPTIAIRLRQERAR